MGTTFKFIFPVILVLCSIFAFLSMVLSGCASVTVDPDTGEVSYYRIGNQRISGLTVETPTGWKITFDQESKTEALKTAMKIAEALE